MRNLIFLVTSLTALLLAEPAGAQTNLKPSQLKRYATAAGLLATADPTGTIAYAIDTDTFYVRNTGAWNGLSTLTTLTGSNGGTFTNGTNNIWDMLENAQHLKFDFTTAGTMLLASSEFTILSSPFQLKLSAGAGELQFTGASSSITTTDNSATGLIIGSTGALSTLTL